MLGHEVSYFALLPSSNRDRDATVALLNFVSNLLYQAQARPLHMDYLWSHLLGAPNMPHPGLFNRHKVHFRYLRAR